MPSLIKRTFLVFACLCVIAVQNLVAQSEHDLENQLRADYAAMTDAQAEYDQTLKTGNISDAERADYAVWLGQVEDQFDQSCRTLSAYSSRAVPVDIPCTEFTPTYFKPLEIDIERETTDGEKTDAITDQFYDSLGEFDEKLLTEQDRVKSQKPRVESENAGAGASGGGDPGGEADGGEGEQGSQSGAMSEQDGSDDSSQGEGTAPGANLPTGSSPGSSSPAGSSSTPDDIPDGSDDDVIARQLREAAEKETDPELQKKLWEEYRRYKSGS